MKATALALTLAAPTSASLPANTQSNALPAAPARFDGTLSVMTYNIHGVPWPVGWGRPLDLAQIATTLRTLRASNRNPHIVVLQEAFTAEAQAIGREAGYRYIVDGPSAEMASTDKPTTTDVAFAGGGSWMRGEGLGKYVSSGLQILSDFPIVGMRRMAYPAFACAGFDCLANKGALLASVALPGRPDPLDIVTTHLNSRHASGVDDARSFHAYRRQIGYLTNFIRAAHDPARALIVAGDFNVGKAIPRRLGLLTQVRAKWVQDGDIDDAYSEAVRMRMPLCADARFSHERGRDWQFYTPGKATDLKLRSINVPFGHATDGSMLSDHVGYTAVFDIAQRDVTRSARPTA
jgi:endonuclease/exonuclease/phosphatase family metal-dependent hydrolase